MPLDHGDLVAFVVKRDFVHESSDEHDTAAAGLEKILGIGWIRQTIGVESFPFVAHPERGFIGVDPSRDVDASQAERLKP